MSSIKSFSEIGMCKVICSDWLYPSNAQLRPIEAKDSIQESIGNDNEIFILMIDWFKLIASDYEKEKTLLLISYFIKTNNTFKAFKILLDDDSENRNINWSAACYLADKYCLDYIINQYKSKLLSDNVIYAIRNGLGWHNKKFHDYFYTEINQISCDKFIYPPQRNYEVERLEMYAEQIRENIQDMMNDYSA